MIGTTIRIDNRGLERAIREAPQRAGQAVRAAAFEGERYVKQSFGTSPSLPGEPPGVDTGKLRAGINVQSRGSFSQAITTGDTEYAIHLEYGTHRMAARPFMAPMAAWLEGELNRIFDRFLES
jgi:hypothetical protein